MAISPESFDAADKFLINKGLDGLPVADPLRISVEAGIFYSRNPKTAVVAAISAAGSMPPNSTDFQRGVAYGVALALAE